MNVSQQVSSQTEQPTSTEPKKKRTRAKGAKLDVPRPQTEKADSVSTNNDQLSIAKPKKGKRRAELANTNASTDPEEKILYPSIKEPEFSSLAEQREQSAVMVQEASVKNTQPSLAKQGKGKQSTKSGASTTKKLRRHPLVLRVGTRALATITESQKNARQARASPDQDGIDVSVHESKSLGAINPEEFMSRLDEWVRKYQDLPVPKQRPPPVSDLVGYAARSEEERLSALDNMLCNCLDDENFVKLVEDVEKSWKRIGLGF